LNGLQLPSWIIPAAGLAAVVWAIAMWWMVATLPSTGSSEAALNLIVARAEIDQLEVTVDELSQEVATLHRERAELSLRMEALEQTPAAAFSVETRQPTAEVAGPPPAESDTPRAATTTSVTTPVATATPAPEPAIAVAVSPSAQYVTDGRDHRYNCKDFNSWEEAQAAYEANLPGDPNKIDIDHNGVACEALR